MSPTDKDGNTDISRRWLKSFEDEGMDIVIIPVGAPDMDTTLSYLDALLMPGGDSNVHPIHYDAHYGATHTLYDYDRDVFAFKLLKRSYDLNMPTLGICRGMQEMIVAFGGTIEHLNTDIDHAQGYKNSKLPNGDRCIKKMDLPVHDFNIQRGGVLDTLYKDKTLPVNSIHMEGITLDMFNSPKCAMLREVYNVEALAPDGVIEAISAIGKDCYLGFQPHGEIEGEIHDALYGYVFKNIYDHHQQRTRRGNAPTINTPLVHR